MLPLVKVGLPDKEILMPRLEEVIYSGVIAEGENVYSFEKEFSEVFGYKNSFAMSSGTACLHASLFLSGVEAGDEVITTSMTAEPTNLSIIYAGGIPVFADVDGAGNICPKSVKSKISSKTKAIIAVHYAGYPVQLSELREIADENGISLIEDCAHALGATYKGKPVGIVGDFSIFSFQAIKHMTTIDGGMLISKKPLDEEIKRFRWFGMLKGGDRTKMDISTIGYKYNMTNVAAVVGSCQLESITSRLKRHIDNGKYYDRALSGVKGVELVALPEFVRPSYWLYTLKVDDSDDLIKKLNAIGVQASKLHKPNHNHSIFNASDVTLPCLNDFYNKLVHIPCGWWVDDNYREKIVECIIGN